MDYSLDAIVLVAIIALIAPGPLLFFVPRRLHYAAEESWNTTFSGRYTASNSMKNGFFIVLDTKPNFFRRLRAAPSPILAGATRWFNS